MLKTNALLIVLFVSNVIALVTSSVRRSSSSSTQNTRQFNRFRGRGRALQGRGFTPRRQVNEATEVSETKTDKSE